MARFSRFATLVGLLAATGAGPAAAQGFKFEYKADSIRIDKDGVKVEGGRTKFTPIEPAIVRLKKQLVALKLWQGKLDDKIDDKLRAAAKKYRESVGFNPAMPMITFFNDEAMIADMIVEQNVKAKKWALAHKRVFEPEGLKEKAPHFRIGIDLFAPVGATLSDDGETWTKGKESGPTHRRFAALIGNAVVRFDPGETKMEKCCGALGSWHDETARIVFETPLDDPKCRLRRDVFSLKGSSLEYRRRKTFCDLDIAAARVDAGKLAFDRPSYVVANFAGPYPARLGYDGDEFKLIAIEHDIPLASYAAFAGKPAGKPGDGAGKTIFDDRLVALVKALAPRAGAVLGKVTFGTVTADDGALIVRGQTGLFDRLTLLIDPARGRVVTCSSDFNKNEIAATDVQPPRTIEGDREKVCPTTTAGLRALADKPPAAPDED